MTDAFAPLIEPLLKREGGYVDHPADRGGPTKWGITQAVARENGYTGHMRDLPRAEAVRIYRAKYWTRPGFDRVHALSTEVAEELFDTGVNMGPGVAAEFLQLALNALNNGGRDYADLKPDGDVGPATLAALGSYLRRRGTEGAKVLLTALNVLQGARYLSIAAARPSQEAFVYGWLRTRVAFAA